MRCSKDLKAGLASSPDDIDLRSVFALAIESIQAADDGLLAVQRAAFAMNDYPVRSGAEQALRSVADRLSEMAIRDRGGRGASVSARGTARRSEAERPFPSAAPERRAAARYEEEEEEEEEEREGVEACRVMRKLVVKITRR